MNPRLNRLIALAAILLAASVTWGHPQSKGLLDIVVNADKITVRASVTVEEVNVTNKVTDPLIPEGDVAFRQHADYFAAHLHFSADGKALTGRVVSITPPPDPATSKGVFAVYDLEYPLPATSPKRIELWQDVLVDGHFAPGASWDPSYVIKMSQAGQAGMEGLLLTRTQPIRFDCDWNPSQAAGTPAPHTVTRGALFKNYIQAGIEHILTGYDHLLFISALVLAATSVWDLIKVVSAFTISHTITLTLAALNLVHVPAAVSEPLISLSIVFVALQNVFWPRQSRGWVRLAAAFFFGLFHGLGFAGDLLETMKQMQGTTVLLAILAFSIGVETGHQMIVLPLFAALKIARQTRPTDLARQRLSFNMQRFGSAAISLGGLYFLVLALRMSFSGTAAP